MKNRGVLTERQALEAYKLGIEERRGTNKELQAKLDKATNYKNHSVALEDIAKLPSQMANPLFAFKGSAKNSLVLVTELEDKAGNDVIVALHLNRLHLRMKVNKIASVYGKDNATRYVNNQIESGNLIYADKKRRDNRFTIRRLQLPGMVQTLFSLNDSIPQSKKMQQKILKSSILTVTAKKNTTLMKTERLSLIRVNIRWKILLLAKQR